MLDQLEACDIYLTPYPGPAAIDLGHAQLCGGARQGGRSRPPISTPANCCATESASWSSRRPRPLPSGQRPARRSGPTAGAAAARLCRGPRNDLAALCRCRRRAGRRRRSRSRFTPAPLSRARVRRRWSAMSDGTGMLQHAIGVVPDRRHGYCLDDNVRALMLMNLAEDIDLAERDRLRQTYASFIQHAWNPEAAAFRNFMRFDRTWCEDCGSEDSNGRALVGAGPDRSRCADDPELRAVGQALVRHRAAALCRRWARRGPRPLRCSAPRPCCARMPDHAASRTPARDWRRLPPTPARRRSAGPTGPGSRRCSATTTRGCRRR